MLVRFTCPACGQTHSFDMPETTIHMTCGRTGQALEVRLTGGGDAKARLVGEQGASAAADKKP
ncbi:MAG: hypothetical protein ACYSUQ_06445 [Planctomycetota bacterium]|jgi:hypothetical protein